MTVSSAGKLRSVLCVLTCTAVILSFYSASASSFGNLVASATLGTSTTAHPEEKHIVEGGQSCVTFTPSGQNSPLVDLRLDERGIQKNIQTVFVYLPKGTSKDDITFKKIPGYKELAVSLTEPLQEADTNMDIYQWDGYETATHIRIRGQYGQEMTLCLVKAYDKTRKEYCECSNPCHTNGDAVCTGVCPHKPEDNCPRINVAQDKAAEMDSSYKESKASYAVNGITGTTFSTSNYTNDQTQWNCVHTGSESQSYWQVDLGDTYTINYLTVYRRGSEPGRKRMKGVEVTVDSQTCTTIDNMWEERQDLFCTSGPLTGQVVKFSNADNFINLCEVQVWVCKPGHYGTRCDEKCSEGCEQGQCDNSGTCDHGCKPGWYGPTCDRECGHCQGRCNPNTGHCDACEPGYRGQFCKNRCSSDCTGSTPECHQNGTCKGCRDGWYGDQCTALCGQCQSGRCAQNTGLCPGGCKPNWDGQECNVCVDGKYGRQCDQECGTGCNDPCDRWTGQCSCRPGYQTDLCRQKCRKGRYGQDCGQWCSATCEDSQCHHVTGQCQCRAGYRKVDDECQPCEGGTYGENCSKKCGAGCQSTCDKERGTCSCKPGYVTGLCNQVCPKGSYGQNCWQQCSASCEDRQCHHVTGQCQCRAGYRKVNEECQPCEGGTYGKNCSKTCSAGCQSTCDKERGTCSCKPGYVEGLCIQECAKGNFGQDCGQKCNEHCQGGECHHVTGQCQCVAGYQRVDTDCQECSRTHYGINCSNACGQCAEDKHRCHMETGHCHLQSCKEGFQPPLCVVKVPEGSSFLTVIIVVVVVVILIVVVIGIAVYYRWRGYWPWKRPRPCPTTGPGKSRDTNRVYFETAQGGSNTATVAAAGVSSPPDEDDALDEPLGDSEDETSMEEDERWAVYQSIKMFLDRQQQQLLDQLSDKDQLRSEYKSLPQGFQQRHTVGGLPGNNNKNRFRMILPYDHSLVVLNANEESVYTNAVDNYTSANYINANYIRNLRDEKAYIATQGPMRQTLEDFWFMVWQERVTHVVMLTNLKENDKNKCTQYWPEKGSRMKYGDITVVGRDVQLRADFLIRTFRIFKKDNDRTVTQYHMVVWPDHGVPSVLALLNLVNFVNLRAKADSGPLLVHCSAGVGRTGTYIALDMLMEEMKHGQTLNVLTAVKRMREDRMSMVQTVEQYMFLHEVVLECYTSRNTRLTEEQMDSIFPAIVDPNNNHPRIDNEFKNLCQMKNFLSKPAHAMAKMRANLPKNRDCSVLADDAHLVYLSTHVQGRNQYINAVSVPSFHQRRGMLMTQLPLADTMVDLWRLVEGFGVTTIVSISSREEERRVDYCQYWPLAQENPVRCGPYGIKITSSKTLGESLASYSVTVEKMGALFCEVQLFHLQDWQGEMPASTHDLIHLLTTLNSKPGDEDAKPIIFQCWDGATKSGIVCALNIIISRLIHDNQLDVYLPVRQLQHIRPQAISSQVQYRFLYQAALEYKRNFAIYVNS